MIVIRKKTHHGSRPILRLRHSNVVKVGRLPSVYDQQKKLSQIMDRYEPKVVEMFTDAFELDASKIDTKKIAAAYDAGDIQAAKAAVNIDYGFVVGGLADVEHEALTAGAKLMFNEIPKKIMDRMPVGGNLFEFDPMKPHVMAWVQDNAAYAISGIEETSKDAIRESITRHFNGDMSSRELVRSIKANIGLTPQQMKSSDLIYKRMLEEGVPREKRDKAIARYAEKQRTQRAKLIADNELHLAVSNGRIAMWDQAITEGDVPKDVMTREWLTARDEVVCPICLPMDGKKVNYNQPYKLPNGTETMIAHGHSRCRCTDLIDMDEELLKAKEDE